MRQPEVPTLPFRGEFGDSINIAALAAQNRAGAGEALLAALLKDPHLAALDGDLDFAEAVRAARQGTFDRGAFLDRGHQAVAGYLRRSRSTLATVFTRDAAIDVLLRQKLASVVIPLARAPARVRCARLKPSRQVRELFGRRAEVVPLTRVSRATVLYTDQAPEAGARFAWRISTPDDPPSGAAGTARCEFGRAVFVNDVDLDASSGEIRPAQSSTECPGHVRTQIVIKGVGPTRFADNRFSRRASGHLTWWQGDRDWRHSQILAEGGVPVYRPLELSLLPYCTWHPTMGWQPMVVYARLPLENLRISDVELLSARRMRDVVAALRVKLAAMSGATPRQITAADVVAVVVARLGRVAGLFESGCTCGGRPFFHGFLHPQNVSLLGEIVDLGEGRFVDGGRSLEAAYAQSGYVNPKRNWTPRVRRARREVVLFQDLVHRFSRWMRSVTAAASLRQKQVDALFWQSYDEGRDGRRADCCAELLGAARSRTR